MNVNGIRQYTKSKSFGVLITNTVNCIQLNSENFTWEVISELKWIKEEQNVAKKVTSVEIEHEGIYVCHAENSEGDVVSKESYLEVKCEFCNHD